MPAEGDSPARLTPRRGGAVGDAVVLVVEASTPNASVAVLRGRGTLAWRQVRMEAGGGDALLPAIDAALREAGLAPGALGGALDAVVCGAGPGGFTSLRIAAAAAKGIAHASGSGLAELPSLALPAVAASPGDAAGTREVLVTLDALRGARYGARVRTSAEGGVVAVVAYEELGVLGAADLARERDAARRAGAVEIDANAHPPDARHAAACPWTASALDGWEPRYGRAAEAQVRWEAAHGRPLPR